MRLDKIFQVSPKCAALRPQHFSLAIAAALSVVFMCASAADAQRRVRKRKSPRAPIHKVDACQILTPQIATQLGAPNDITPKPPSKYGFSPHPRCSYAWPVKDREAKEKAYRQTIASFNRQSAARMSAGKPAGKIPRPPVLAETVGLTWLKTSANADAAKAEMAAAVETLRQGITATADIKRVDGKRGKATVRVDTEKMDARTKARARALERQAERQLVPPPGAPGSGRTVKQTIRLQYVNVPGIGDEAVWSSVGGSLMVRRGAQRLTIDAQRVPFARGDDGAYDYTTDPNFITAKAAALAVLAKAK